MAQAGFPKKLRLLNAADYKAVFSGAQFKVSCRHFLILAISTPAASPRLGLVIAKKNVSKAVHRNRIKRLIRNSFRLNQSLLASLDIVVLARQKSDSLENNVIDEKISVLWSDLQNKSKQAGISKASQ
ncbi:MAG: ribonuclease P protein component [SAR86 cluster bacterium]|uniref:Ribonuclease P protein component n=1 Tax=SAR86 cluster bacterium TaxID=2030880 RepID=A0A2A4MRP3_9GAMM|nr:MAG: ribonuclease P protein component [SAR86 cluster bacterium]